MELGKKKSMLLSSRAFYSHSLGNIKGFINPFKRVPNKGPPAQCHWSQSNKTKLGSKQSSIL